MGIYVLTIKVLRPVLIKILVHTTQQTLSVHVHLKEQIMHWYSVCTLIDTGAYRSFQIIKSSSILFYYAYTICIRITGSSTHFLIRVNWFLILVVRSSCRHGVDWLVPFSTPLTELFRLMGLYLIIVCAPTLSTCMYILKLKFSFKTDVFI